MRTVDSVDVIYQPDIDCLGLAVSNPVVAAFDEIDVILVDG